MPDKAAVSALTTLILAGGLGTRLRPAVGALPKALARVAEKPFLDYLLSYLKNEGVRDIILCTGYGAEKIESYCGDGSGRGLQIRYSKEEKPLGTGGAIKYAGEKIKSDPFLVMNGDSILYAELSGFLGFHLKKNALLSMLLTTVEETGRFGSVTVGGDGAVKIFSEKTRKGKNVINAGVYLFGRAVLNQIPSGIEVSLEREVFPAYAGKGLYGMVVPGPFIDIGTPESYANAKATLSLTLPPRGGGKGEGATR